MQKLELILNNADRIALEKLTKAKDINARVMKRSLVLLSLNDNVSEKCIIKCVRVTRPLIWRTKSLYLNKGLAAAIYDDPRPGQPKKFTDDDKAQLSALACSTPPKGHAKWTTKLLASELSKLIKNR
jgi:transposase